MRPIHKVIWLGLVLCGLILGCSSQTNTSKTVGEATDVNAIMPKRGDKKDTK